MTRTDGVVDVSTLEFTIREDLNENAPRAMCVLNPLKVILSNYPKDKTEILTAPGHPNRDDFTPRKLPFGREIWIDQADFREAANKKYKRLVINKRVRLRNAYIIEADKAIKDDAGNIIAVHARIIADTVGKNPADGIKAKGVIHWVSAQDNLDCEVRIYDRLFTQAEPAAGGRDFMQSINPDSLQILTGCKVEAALVVDAPETHYQFEREGYFIQDSKQSSADKLVFNQTISLRDTWAKINKQA